MKTNHVVVWLDHKEAHILFFDTDNNKIIRSESSQPHLHHKANEIGSGNAPEDHHYFARIMTNVSEAAEILIVGPGFAKGELLKHATHFEPLIAKRIIGIETVDHPTDGQILAYAKKFFKKFDQLNAI
jgi:stalled ribosome rescue protein Dom34